MAFELLICAVHFPPGVKNTVYPFDQMGKRLQYPVSTFVTAFMLLRVYLIFRMYTRFSVYRSTFADRCCAKVGIEADMVFALKSSFKTSPFKLLFITFLVSVVSLGLAVRLFERQVSCLYDDTI